MNIPFEQLPLLLLVTITVEYLVWLLLVRKKPLKLLLYAVLVNCVTWPLATFVYYSVFPQYFLLETLVFITEIVLLKLLLQIRMKKAVLLSFAANFVTALIGFVIASL
ncbi:MAG: hypothetical protein NTU57_02020 [Candidatus Aenigmarchaeota archaeon]|nr:hypothetical protein [Candidatus Aenigmarchaeota archaeon]